MIGNRQSRAMTAAARRAVRCGTSPEGFTLIEMLIVIGTVMILIGLLIPGLAKARSSAKDIVMASQSRSNASLVSVYSASHRDLFPCMSETVGDGMLMWDTALVRAGVIDSESETDPAGMKAHGLTRFAMSAAMCCEPGRMVPGAAEPLHQARTVTITQSAVWFPSEKGMLVQWLYVEGDEHRFWTYSVHLPPRSPIAMCDGSVIAAKCVDFRLEHDFFEHWVGHPVLSTWNGVNGRDSRW
jgi:competence protein ComGC